MSRHARTILAPTFVAILTLGLIAGAEPSGPKPHGFIVEGLADGKIRIGHTSPDGKSVDFTVERLGDGRYSFSVGGEIKATCKSFRLEDGKGCDLFGDVELKCDKMTMKADRMWFNLFKTASEKIRVKTTNSIP